ncbi:MAG: M3 family metallopeptidase, partial [Ktedonobacterales bacterium]
MSTPAEALPRWDMSVVYPSLESPEFAAGFAATVAAIDDLGRLFDALGIAKREPAPLDDATVRTYEDATNAYNDVLRRVMTLSAYIAAFVTTNTRDDLAQARQSELQQHAVRLAQLGTRYTAWIGALDVSELIERSPLAAEHAFALRQAKERAAHLMSPAEEALAAELGVTGGSAWAKLHGNVSSQLVVPVALVGETRELPMSAVRNLAFDRDREVRRQAYEAELAGWERVAVPLAAALNSIKGQGNTLARHRGWATPLDAAIFDANIDRQTLDAMMTAAFESFPDFRRYLKAKARALGIERLAWYDLFAPVGEAGRAWSFDEAARFVVAQFGTY